MRAAVYFVMRNFSRRSFAIRNKYCETSPWEITQYLLRNEYCEISPYCKTKQNFSETSQEEISVVVSQCIQKLPVGSWRHCANNRLACSSMEPLFGSRHRDPTWTTGQLAKEHRRAWNADMPTQTVPDSGWVVKLRKLILNGTRIPRNFLEKILQLSQLFTTVQAA